MGTIQEAFMSTDPKMVELRTQMSVQAGVLPQGQMSSGTSQLQQYPTDEITKPTLGILQVPWGRTGRKKNVAHGFVQPLDPKARY
jgi:hypothetical protein